MCEWKPSGISFMLQKLNFYKISSVTWHRKISLYSQVTFILLSNTQLHFLQMYKLFFVFQKITAFIDFLRTYFSSSPSQLSLDFLCHFSFLEYSLLSSEYYYSFSTDNILQLKFFFLFETNKRKFIHIWSSKTKIIFSLVDYIS